MFAHVVIYVKAALLVCACLAPTVFLAVFGRCN